MLGQPKRSGKCHLCKKRGTCGCQRRINAELKQAKEKKPETLPHSCTVVLGDGKACGQTVRGGVCPSPWH